MGACGYSLVIPSWNDGARVSQTLKRYLPVFDESEIPVEIIIVSEGDPRELEAAIMPFRDKVVVRHFPSRLGKGGAVLAGFEMSTHDRVGFVDSDGPIPPAEILEMFNELDLQDCVVASRWLPDSKVIVSQNFSRRMLSRAWNIMVRGILFLPLRDTQCGAKFFRKESVTAVASSVIITNWAFDVSLLFHLVETRHSVKEHPVTWSDAAESKLQISTAVPSMLLALVGIRVMSLPVSKFIPKKWIQWYTERWSTV